MKLLKIILFFVSFCIIAASAFCVSVSADEYDYKENKYLYDEEEYQEIYAKALKKARNIDGNLVIKSFDQQINIEQDIKYAYKYYYAFSQYGIANMYKRGVMFNEFLSESSGWILTTFKGVDLIFSDTSGFGERMPTNPTAILDFDLVDKALNELGYSFDDDEVIVKYVRFFPYYFVPTIVYINVQGKEFFIPYATNPYMTDFKNGEIYEIKELIPHIAESEKGVFEPPEVPKEEKIIVWSIVGAVLIAIIAICALILKSDRKTQKA